MLRRRGLGRGRDRGEVEEERWKGGEGGWERGESGDGKRERAGMGQGDFGLQLTKTSVKPSESCEAGMALCRVLSQAGVFLLSC